MKWRDAVIAMKKECFFMFRNGNRLKCMQNGSIFINFVSNSMACRSSIRKMNKREESRERNGEQNVLNGINSESRLSEISLSVHYLGETVKSIDFVTSHNHDNGIFPVH